LLRKHVGSNRSRLEKRVIPGGIAHEPGSTSLIKVVSIEDEATARRRRADEAGRLEER